MQFTYDVELARTVAQEARSIDDVVQMLQAIGELLDATRDGLHWFNQLYLEVTLAVKAQWGPGFIWDLDFRFANFYFAALRQWLGGNEAPESWRVLLEQRANVNLARIQFALAGVNAHINRDLAVAVVATCPQPKHDSAEYQAYTALNATLDSLIERAKQELMVRLPGDALPAVDRVESVVASWGVSAARETAWVHAEILAAIGDGNESLAQRFIQSMDGTAALAGKALMLVC